MMKKVSKIFITLILLFSIGVSNASAASWKFNRFGRAWAENTTATLKSKGLITYDWRAETNKHLLCANEDDGSHGNCKKQSHLSWWNVFTVYNGKKNGYYISYCVNPYLSVKHDEPMTAYNNLDELKFSIAVPEEIKTERKELLKQLLLYGYNLAPGNNKYASTVIKNDNHNYLKLIAMQVLVWEVTTGGRTSFDTIEPNVWGGEPIEEHKYSFYNQIIKPNGSDDPTKKDTLYYYYSDIVNNVRLGDSKVPAPAFDEDHYTMSWDSLNKKYTVTVNGLGDYKECTSNNKKVTVIEDDENKTVTLSSTETITNAEISCSYARGNGAGKSGESFKFFKFTNHKNYQDMLYGAGWKVYTKKFKVSSENSNLLIKKVDVDNKLVSGAKFTLTHMTNLDYSVNIDGNGSAQNLIFGGKYRVSETTIPDGFDKINDFNITIKGDTHKITSCDGQKTDDAGTVVSCLNNQVKVAYANNGTIELTIIDMPKNIKILKVNKDGSPINGAAFEIRDKNNTLLKFSVGAGNVYKFDAAGTVTTISNPSVNPYTIALLPEGEYKIIETAAPANYRLPIDEASRTTLIKINANRELSIYDNNRKTYVPAGTATVRVINYNTNIKVHKTGNGKPLEGVQFELYNSDRSVKIKSTMGFPGRYTYADDQTTAENTVYVTNASGDITIDNVPEGTYYLKEIATIEPYVLPDGVYTKVDIKVDEKGVSVNGNYTLSTIEISNTPNSFNFYKRDPEGNSLSGGKYKLQKYNKKTKKYEDVKLSEVQNDGTYADNSDVFKEDSTNGEIQFTLTKGVATFIDMESATTYRIIEIEAPEGYDKVSADDTAIVTIDEHGNASGLLVLVDPPLPDEDASAFAELIINIQTGKQRILYAAVIFVVVGAIAGLIIYNNKKKK